MNQAYVMTADRPVPQYRPAEITLSGMTGRNNPYAEIEVEAEFVSPSGRPFRQPAFWDGGNIWKIRFAPDEPGKWSWKTVCTDPSDKGLHGVTGVLECVPNGGDLDLERHGMIRVGGGGRYFVHADGTPFLWLGDTHWMMFDTESLNDCNHPAHKGGKCPFGGLMQHIAAVRCRNGFTVFQTYPNAGKNWFMKDRTDMVDPEHFRQAFDPVMEHLASLGFVIALGVGHYTASVRIPEADLCRWGRYIAARYGAFPVVWITCQEMNSPAIQGGAEANRQAVWEKVAAEIARALLLSKRERHDNWNARLSRLSSTGTMRSTPLAPRMPRLIKLEIIH